MEILIRILLVANLACSAWLFWRHLQLRRELQGAALRLDKFGALANSLPALPLSQRTSLISVAILNPMELAAKESSFARMFGSVTPELVKREVYKEIRRRLVVQLEEEGVVAEVRLHNGL